MPLEGLITLMPLTPDGLAGGEYRMKKLILFAALVLFSAPMAFAQTQGSCVKIQSGTILDVNGVVITTGYDQWGYNYQAHMFNGLYDNNTRPPVPVTTGDVNLSMKWSDEWLSNLDCNGDHRLDRGLNPKTGASSGVSKGWLTNHEEGDYTGTDGEIHHYTYFVKIVYDNGASCATGSDSCLWGLYTIIEEVNNDPFGGFHGVNRDSLVNPAGSGFWTK